MKKMTVLVVVMVLLAVVTATACAATYYVDTPRGSNVRVRAGRGTEYEKIGTLAYGEAVEVQSIENGWAKIVWGSYGDGYVSAQYLSRWQPGPHPVDPDPQPQPGGGTLADNFNSLRSADYHVQVVPSTASGYVNLRWAPSKEMPVMSIRRSGSVLRVIAENDTWCQVYDEVTNECGYMMKSFLLMLE